MRKLKGQIWKCELHYCAALLLLNIHNVQVQNCLTSSLYSVRTLSTTHHRLLPIRAGNVALPLLNTHNVQVLNCLLTATAARLDQDTASPNWTKPLWDSAPAQVLSLLALWKSAQVLSSSNCDSKMSTTTTTTALLTWLCPHLPVGNNWQLPCQIVNSIN